MILEKTESGSENLQKHTFPKEEKLCSKKQIEELFKKGSSTFLYPFRITSLHCEDRPSHFPQILISVPKKRFKRAVDRNRLKRQIREAYRINKNGIFFELNQEKIPCYLGIVYVGKEKLPFSLIEKKLISILSRL